MPKPAVTASHPVTSTLAAKRIMPDTRPIELCDPRHTRFVAAAHSVCVHIQRGGKRVTLCGRNVNAAYAGLSDTAVKPTVLCAECGTIAQKHGLAQRQAQPEPVTAKPVSTAQPAEVPA